MSCKYGIWKLNNNEDYDYVCQLNGHCCSTNDNNVDKCIAITIEQEKDRYNHTTR